MKNCKLHKEKRRWATIAVIMISGLFLMTVGTGSAIADSESVDTQASQTLTTVQTTNDGSQVIVFRQDKTPTSSTDIINNQSEEVSQSAPYDVLAKDTDQDNPSQADSTSQVVEAETVVPASDGVIVQQTSQVQEQEGGIAIAIASLTNHRFELLPNIQEFEENEA